jgi:hypothetical protein
VRSERIFVLLCRVLPRQTLIGTSTFWPGMCALERVLRTSRIRIQLPKSHCGRVHQALLLRPINLLTKQTLQNPRISPLQISSLPFEQNRYERQKEGCWHGGITGTRHTRSYQKAEEERCKNISRSRYGSQSLVLLGCGDPVSACIMVRDIDRRCTSFRSRSAREAVNLVAKDPSSNNAFRSPVAFLI